MTPIFSLFLSALDSGHLPGGIKSAPGAGRTKRRTGSEAGSKLPKDSQRVSGGARTGWAALQLAGNLLLPDSAEPWTLA